MKKLIFLALILGLILPGSMVFAQPSNPPTKVTEEDGAPNVLIGTIKFPNGSVTDNGDGTASVSVRQRPQVILPRPRMLG